MGLLGSSGFVIYRHDPRVAEWSDKAAEVMRPITLDPAAQATNLRHAKHGLWVLTRFLMRQTGPLLMYR